MKRTGEVGVRARARQVGRTSGFVSLTAMMLPAMLAHTRSIASIERREDVRDAWVRIWARSLMKLFAVHAIVDGVVPRPRTRGAPGLLVVANHRSAIDIGVLLATFGGTMVSRADLAAWPLVGQAARSVGTIFVDRQRTESGAATIRVLQKALARGKTVTIFPEGATFDGDEVRPFHRGAFVAAANAGVDILPVGLAYPKASDAAYLDESFPEHLGRLARGQRSEMGLSIGTPFSARERAKALTERAESDVSALVRRARALCGP